MTNRADSEADKDRNPHSETFKSLALERYLEGELSFDDLAGVVGLEKAILTRDINWAMKESIESAKADFADSREPPDKFR